MYLKIETKLELIKLVSSIENSAISWLAIDTEFFRETTYYPVLSLVQIATASQIWVIDAISCCDITPLKSILENPNIKKIFHAGDQDWVILKQCTGAKIWPFVDTQFMAVFARLGYGASLENLVFELLGETVDKSQQKTNWVKRPLTSEQLAYAAQDAKFVAGIYPILEQKIISLGRESWVDEEMLSLFHKYDNASFDKDWLKLCTKGNVKWPVPFYAYKLAKWREEWAKKLDLPRRHVLVDEALEQVLQKNSVDHVKSYCCLLEVYEDLKIFWQALQKNVVTKEDKAHLEQIANDYHHVFTQNQLKLIKSWQSHAKAISNDLGIPAFLLLNKQQIHRLAHQDNSSIAGWRLQYLSKIDLWQSL
jgi:ribonuclease D